LDVCDETDDPGRDGYSYVPSATANLSGTTHGGAPFSMDGTMTGGWLLFKHVPLGEYTMTHGAPGYLVSDPATQAVSIEASATDAYTLVVSPSALVGWLNRWGSVDGTTSVIGTTEPVPSVNLVLNGSDATSASVSASNGRFHFGRICEGDYTLKVTKPGWRRETQPVHVSPSTTTLVSVPMTKTTDGYLMGTITDQSGAPAINEPDIWGDDPEVDVKYPDGHTVIHKLHDGTFDIALPAGAYTLTYKSPGYLTRADVAVSISAGVEKDASTALVLDVSGLYHKRTAERWMVGWTMKANWGGEQPSGSEVEDFNIYQWYGLSRFTFDCDYQRVGTQHYIQLVKPRFTGELWDWHYLKLFFIGMVPPDAPALFKYGQPKLGWQGWFNFGFTKEYYEPPMLNSTTQWNRTGIRADGIDIVDQRDYSVVSKIRSQWDSCAEKDGHLYGSVGGADGDGTFSPYSHNVPFGDQLVRLWVTVGKMDQDSGQFKLSPFDDISRLNMGELMNANGSSRLALYWRPNDGALWVEPALSNYP
jgi:hypothetical protein